jgi:hypothetical protein
MTYPHKLYKELASDLLLNKLGLLIHKAKDIRWVIRNELAFVGDQLLVVAAVEVVAIGLHAV